ncbi:MAG: hypothetical protein ACK5LP_07970 [Campylobacteraceae bacterium]
MNKQLVLSTLAALSLTAVTAFANTIVVQNDGVNIKVPLEPKKVAVMDFGAVDTIVALGKKDVIAAMPKSAPDYLRSLSYDANIIDLGGLRSIDLVAVANAKPEVIF